MFLFWCGIPEQLVVLGQTLRSAGSARLDLGKERRGPGFKTSIADHVPFNESQSYLSSAETDHQVSDEGVLRLPGTMADHHTPAVALGHLAAGRKKCSDP